MVLPVRIGRINYPSRRKSKEARTRGVCFMFFVHQQYKESRAPDPRLPKCDR
jgi:hypothetical protein